MLEYDIIEAIKDIKDDKQAVLKKWDMGLAFAQVMTEGGMDELYAGLCTPTTCRYCGKYASNDCIGCPISNKTTTSECKKTPLMELGKALAGVRTYNKEKIIKAIEAEIEFLKEV